MPVTRPAPVTRAAGSVTALDAFDRRPPRVGPVKACPTHRVPLDGGPVLFRCAAGGHAVYAADLPHEITTTEQATVPATVPAVGRAAA